LERLRQEVIVVNDGAEAWRVVEQTWFPIIISDWVMPSLDGLDLCRLVRKRKQIHFIDPESAFLYSHDDLPLIDGR